MTMIEKVDRKLTGWHVLAMFVAFFGVIIAVNFTLAWKAISTFPGIEVENGYIASQSFDRDRAAQKALNWTLTPSYDAVAHQLRLAFLDDAGRPVTLAALSVLVGRTTETSDDQRPEFVVVDGVYVAPANLAMGKWMMAVEARAEDGTRFHQRLDLHVRP
jgi:nitrogen fixation protein FixH